MPDPWSLYDRLLAGIPEDITVEDYGIGVAWSFVRARGSVGVALTVRQRAGHPDDHAPIIGRPLREVAELVKSWHFLEASIGMAAINCWYNHPERAEALGLLDSEKGQGGEAFRVFGDAVRGKNVAVIGHFPYLERTLGPLCNLSILEREPQKGDYPDSASEYILPEQDYIFITGMTLTNKTLPRLLELCQNGKVCLVGPSAPLSEVLFDFGVSCVSGFTPVYPEKAMEALRRGVKQGIFKGGQMVNFYPETIGE